MKQYIFYALCLLCGVLFSCDNERSGLVKTGTVLLGVGKNDVLLTKAGDSVTDEILQVFFINAEEDTIKRFSNYKSEVEGKNILLPVGMYKVCVTSAETNGPVWDKPNYNGETEVEVTAGEYAKAEVECQITNTKVTVQFTNDVKKYFSNYVATITDDADHSIAFEKDESRAAFFSTEKLTVDLLLVNKENGLSFNLKKVFPNIKPRYHYKLKFDVSGGDTPGDDSSGENLDVVIKEDSTQVDVTIKLPQYTQSSDKKAVPKLQVFTDGEESTNLDFSKTWIDEATLLFTDQYLQITSEFPMKYLYVKMSETFDKEQAMFDLMHKDNISPFKLESSDNGQLLSLNITDLVNTMRPNDKNVQTYSLTFYAIDVAHQEKELMLTYEIAPNLSVMPDKPGVEDVWSRFAVLRGHSDKESNYKFKYGIKDTDKSTWKLVEAVVNAKVEGVTHFSALVSDLEPNTDYDFFAITGDDTNEDELATETFTTNMEYQLPNAGFENWTEGTPLLIYGTGEKMFWDSGNHGSATLNKNVTTYDESLKHSETRSIKLSSQFVGAVGFGKFAAGNVFAGKYLDTDGMDGVLGFGRPCSSRPTQLHGYVRYSSGEVDYEDKTNGLSKGEKDEGIIYIALGNWIGESYDGELWPLIIKTKSKQLFNPKDKNIIAYGEKVYKESTDGTGLIEFTIDLEYRSLDKIPTSIIVVCSASKYGDYFSGSTKSMMWLDDLELIYPNGIEDIKTNK